MTANKHTPAPWVMHESATHVRIVGADGENIWHEDKRCHRVMNDARLIAAAPELLEALEAVEGCYQCGNDLNIVMDQVRVAIAKAGGAA